MAIRRQLAVRYALSENCIIWNMQTDISISPDMVLEFRFMLAGTLPLDRNLSQAAS